MDSLHIGSHIVGFGEDEKHYTFRVFRRSLLPEPPKHHVSKMLFLMLINMKVTVLAS